VGRALRARPARATERASHQQAEIEQGIIVMVQFQSASGMRSDYYLVYEDDVRHERVLFLSKGSAAKKGSSELFSLEPKRHPAVTG